MRWIVTPFVLMLALATLVFMVVSSKANAQQFKSVYLTWTPPTTNVIGEPLDGFDLEYQIYWSSDSNRFNPVEGSTTPADEYLLDLSRFRGTCLYLAVATHQISTSLRSELSESVYVCPNDYLRDDTGEPDDSGKPDGGDGSDSGSDPSSPPSAPNPVTNVAVRVLGQ